MGYNKVKLALLAGGLALSASVGAAGPTAAMLANTCAGCHGTNGASNGPATPTIAGMSADFFVDKMKEYQAGTMHSTIMGRIAKGYTEEEIKAMADYFASQPYVAHAQSVDKAKASAGKKLHNSAKCEKCHEDGGKKGDEAGKLAGQWLPYLQNVMDDFRTGKSEMPKKMAKRVENLSEADVDALLQYYAGQD